MRKYLALLLIVVLGACDKHDPILSGTRIDVFDIGAPRVLDATINNLPDIAYVQNTSDCPYVIKPDNTIWSGDNKIFSGLATDNVVSGTRPPVCRGGFVYAGLTTGELVKVNPKNRQIMWIADVFRPTNMTGGAAVLDIVAPAQIVSGYVYAGGLGGAFCKIADASGTPQWCTWIGTAHPFVIAGNAAYVVDTDKKLSAVRLRDGAIYWRAAVKKSMAPQYADKTVYVGDEKFDAATGQRN